jgi:hypothetical protein
MPHCGAQMPHCGAALVRRGAGVTLRAVREVPLMRLVLSRTLTPKEPHPCDIDAVRPRPLFPAGGDRAGGLRSTIVATPGETNQ